MKLSVAWGPWPTMKKRACSPQVQVIKQSHTYNFITWQDLHVQIKPITEVYDPSVRPVYHSRDWSVDLLDANELKLFHNVWNTCTSGQVNSWVIKQIGETHFIPGA